MDRGQEGRPAHDTDETIDAIELAGAPADGDASDESIENGPSTEGSSPEFAPIGGPPAERPPAHWLAYIRARAPWLLSPGGRLGEPTEAVAPDIVPHGSGAHGPSWPSVEPASRAGAATADPAASGDSLTRPFPDRIERFVGDVPEQPARRSDGSAGAPSIDDEGRDRASHRSGIGEAGRRRADQADEVRRAVAPEAAAASRSIEPLGPDATGETPGPVHPRVTWGEDLRADPGQRTRAASSPTFPALDTLDASPPPVAWPALPGPEDGRRRARPGEPWPPPAARAPRAHPRLSMPDDQVTQRAPATFDPPPAPTRRETPPHDLGGWRVRAAGTDTSMIARLALPPWPALPDPPADDDDPDWRAIERRLQRAARLDREQRRR